MTHRYKEPCPNCGRKHEAGEYQSRPADQHDSTQPGSIVYCPPDVRCACGAGLRVTVPIVKRTTSGWVWRVIEPAGGRANGREVSPISEKFTDYEVWLQSEARKQARNWAVTIRHPDGTLTCEVLQWENSNAKWYRLEPYEGREEAGCYFDIWTNQPGANARIIQVRPI